MRRCTALAVLQCLKSRLLIHAKCDWDLEKEIIGPSWITNPGGAVARRRTSRAHPPTPPCLPLRSGALMAANASRLFARLLRKPLRSIGTMTRLGWHASQRLASTETLSDGTTAYPEIQDEIGSCFNQPFWHNIPQGGDEFRCPFRITLS